MGGRAVRDDLDPDGRLDLALPVRPVRLDHPVLATARIAAAAVRQPAVPLRTAGGDRRPRRRAARPGIVDLRTRCFRAALPRGGGRARRAGRYLHAGRGGATDLPAAPQRAGVLRDDRQRQGDIPGAGRGDRARVADHGAGQRHHRGLRLPRHRFAVVPQHLRPAARCGADGGRALVVQGAHPGGDAAVRAVPVHPAGARLQRFRRGALPVPALRRLPQPGGGAEPPRLGAVSPVASAKTG